jgi:hypothetical protein
MYTGCNGATCIYASCLNVARIYIYKILNFCLWNEKNREFHTIEGKGRPSKQDASSVEKIVITDAP